MSDPWAFGWTQVFTIIGFIITLGITFGGFRTFERWKREKLEEKRIDIAIEALALTHESKFIFEHIRSSGGNSYEWAKMPVKDGESEQERLRRGSYFAILTRIRANKEFFNRVWKLQPRFTAVFGKTTEDIFISLHKARREVEVSAEMLVDSPEPDLRSEENLEFWKQMRADVWYAHGKYAKEGDRVAKKLTDFTDGMERICRPVIDRGYRLDGFFSKWRKRSAS